MAFPFYRQKVERPGNLLVRHRAGILVCWAQSSVLRNEVGWSPIVDRLFCRSYLVGSSAASWHDWVCILGRASGLQRKGSLGESATHTISMSAVDLGLNPSQHKHTHPALVTAASENPALLFPSSFPNENLYQQPKFCVYSRPWWKRTGVGGTQDIVPCWGTWNKSLPSFLFCKMKLLEFLCLNALSIFKIVWLLKAVGPIKGFHCGHTPWFLENW